MRSVAKSRWLTRLGALQAAAQSLGEYVRRGCIREPAPHIEREDVGNSSPTVALAVFLPDKQQRGSGGQSRPGTRDAAVAESVIRLQDKPKKRLRSRSYRRFPCGLPGCCQGFWNHEEYYRAGGVEQGAGGSESRGRRPGTGATDDRWVEFLLRRRGYSDWLTGCNQSTLAVAIS
jgi:hypothetical protein